MTNSDFLATIVIGEKWCHSTHHKSLLPRQRPNTLRFSAKNLKIWNLHKLIGRACTFVRRHLRVHWFQPLSPSLIYPHHLCQLSSKLSTNKGRVEKYFWNQASLPSVNMTSRHLKIAFMVASQHLCVSVSLCLLKILVSTHSGRCSSIIMF